jgi:hypothetical protein
VNRHAVLLLVSLRMAISHLLFLDGTEPVLSESKESREGYVVRRRVHRQVKLLVGGRAVAEPAEDDSPRARLFIGYQQHPGEAESGRRFVCSK